MKFNEKWLWSWASPQVSHDELVVRLSMVGLEVDVGLPVVGALSGVMVGEVLSTEQHSDADGLRVCQVSNDSETFQVVCGAPNMRVGLKIPFTMTGTELPGGFKIKETRLRGVESFGMLRSVKELQISEENAGLFELPADVPVGQDVRTYLEPDDYTIGTGPTPNRDDCLLLVGLTCEVNAIYDVPLALVAVGTVATQRDEIRPVELVAPTAYPRYLGRVTRSVSLSRPIPLWMVERLCRSDIRSIDSMADVTSYVMVELGQPMHAFDLAEINGGMYVCMAENDEKLVLLDGQRIILRTDALVIADHQRALVIAGVMSGEHSGVGDSTRDLFSEAASFDTIALVGKTRSYGLHADSSCRFKRGAGSQLTRKAMKRATRSILDIVGGRPGPIVKQVSEAHLSKVVPVNPCAERTTQMFDIPLDTAEIVRLLQAPELAVVADGEGQWSVGVPSHRFDTSLEVDLIKELTRLYGYNRLPVRYPQVRLAPNSKPEARVALPLLRRLLVVCGYQEAITFSFIDLVLFELFDPGTQPLTLTNPISADMVAMRSSLWLDLVKALQHNLNRQQSRVYLFKSGLRLVGQLEGLKQGAMLANVICGKHLPENWTNDHDDVDFFDAKADVEAMLASAGALGDLSPAPDERPALHSGQIARIEREGQLISCSGALHPELAKKLDLGQPVSLFELLLVGVVNGHLPGLRGLSRFPEVRRNPALLVDQDAPTQDILTQIRTTADEQLMGLRPLNMYRGKGIDPHGKSPAVDSTQQHPSRTLNDDEVNSTIQNIIASLEEKFSATLRRQHMGALTKTEIVECLCEELGLNKRETKELVKPFLEEIRQVLEHNEQVKLPGLGNFDLHDKHQRPGRDPKTGEEIPITARRVVTFCLGQKLKARVEAYAGTKS